MAAYLRGEAFDWFEPRIKEFLKLGIEGSSEDTIKIFQNYEQFTKKLQATYSDVDEERTTERKLKALRQKESGSKYTSEFKQISLKLYWPDKPLMA